MPDQAKGLPHERKYSFYSIKDAINEQIENKWGCILNKAVDNSL